MSKNFRDGWEIPYLQGNSDPELMCLPKRTPEEEAEAKAWRDKYFAHLDKHIVITYKNGKCTILHDGEEYDPSDNDTMKA